MPTPDMSDEELDALVRRSAAAYPEEIPLGGWLRMADKLNEAATTRLVRRKIARFFVLEMALVALLLLLWQGHRTLSPASEVARQPTRGSSPAATQPAGAARQPKLAATSDAASTARDAAGSPALFPAVPLHLAVKTPAHPVPAPVGAPAASSDARLSTFPRRRSFAAPLVVALAAPKRRGLPATDAAAYPAASRSGSPERSPNEKPARQNAGSPLPVANALLTREAAGAPTGEGTKPAALVQQLEPVAPDTLARQPVASPSPPADSVATQQAAPARPTYRLVVGLLGAPSVSAVRTFGTARLGGDLGLTVEYRLTSRLRVRTGLIRSVKRYGAASSDYTVPAGWGWRWAAGEYAVNANCRITEIPLDLRYDVVSHPTYTVFAGVGLTSLLMRNERYGYDYWVNGQARTAAIKIVNGSNHAFSLLRLSGGVERPLGSRWSVQAEPFWQLPLGQVGAGKVRLSSAGAAFSLKYGLMR